VSRSHRRTVEVLIYSFFNLCARWWWMVNVTPRPLYRWELDGTHCTGGWLVLRAGLGACGKCRHTGIRPPGLSGPQPVAIPALQKIKSSGKWCTFLYRYWQQSLVSLHSISREAEATQLFLWSPTISNITVRTRKVAVFFIRYTRTARRTVHSHRPPPFRPRTEADTAAETYCFLTWDAGHSP